MALAGGTECSGNSNLFWWDGQGEARVSKLLVCRTRATLVDFPFTLREVLGAGCKNALVWKMDFVLSDLKAHFSWSNSREITPG